MMIKHGPSRSWTDAFDIVDAFPCKNLPEECECLFKRSIPGHFPKPETLEYAKKCHDSSYHRVIHTATQMNASCSGDSQQF